MPSHRPTTFRAFRQRSTDALRDGEGKLGGGEIVAEADKSSPAEANIPRLAEADIPRLAEADISRFAEADNSRLAEADTLSPNCVVLVTPWASRLELKVGDMEVEV